MLIEEIDIVELSCSDWCALYFNNRQITEGHSFNESDLWKYLVKSDRPFRFRTHKSYEVSDELVAEWGYSMPDRLENEHWEQILNEKR